ncbi:hypothetical protein [Pantoea sp. 18069]|uniref:hypothetical protein n=1 Tax=Pantoea sp. 18069 TaxID=2681415 RepID=UPI0013573D30|nr:hypothetical protein [Pantoea sp. 18069]
MSVHHQPKGSMCMSCSNGSAACGQRDFGSMPVIQVYSDCVKAVKCSGHRASAPARRCISCDAAAPAQLEEGQGLPCGH